MDEAVVHENGRLRSLVLLGDRAIPFKSQSICLHHATSPIKGLAIDQSRPTRPLNAAHKTA
jgi:hypothetical protein